MSKFIQRFAKPSRAARRLVSGRRRGSVLILCVVLIVVLALMGTAMLSGTRIDRYTTQQHSYNTQIELLVEGAKQVAKSELARDLYDTTTATLVYRPVRDQSNPAGTGTLANQYDHYDALHIPDPLGAAPTQPYDDWIAPLVPRR